MFIENLTYFVRDVYLNSMSILDQNWSTQVACMCTTRGGVCKRTYFFSSLFFSSPCIHLAVPNLTWGTLFHWLRSEHCGWLNGSGKLLSNIKNLLPGYPRIGWKATSGNVWEFIMHVREFMMHVCLGFYAVQKVSVNNSQVKACTIFWPRRLACAMRACVRHA